MAAKKAQRTQSAEFSESDLCDVCASLRLLLLNTQERTATKMHTGHKAKGLPVSICAPLCLFVALSLCTLERMAAKRRKGRKVQSALIPTLRFLRLFAAIFSCHSEENGRKKAQKTQSESVPNPTFAIFAPLCGYSFSLLI